MLISAALGLQFALSSFPAEWGASAADAMTSSLEVNGESAALEKGMLLSEGRTYITAQDAARVLHAEWKREGMTGTLKLRDDRILTFQLGAGTVAVNGVLDEQGETALIHGGIPAAAMDCGASRA